MSPVAADCASADNAPGELAALVVFDVLLLARGPVEAPPVEVDDERVDEDPQPTKTIEDASRTPKTESLFMASRLAI